MTINILEGDVIKVTARFVWNGESAVQNVFYFRNDGPGVVTPTPLEADVVGLIEDVYTEFVARLNAGLIAQDIDVFNVTQHVPVAIYNWSSITGGGDSSEAMAPGVAALVILRTGFSKVFGRKYFGVWPEVANVGGDMSSAVATDLLDGCARLLGHRLGAGSGNSWLPGVPTKAHGYAGFTDLLLRTDWAYQRRRRQGRGI